MSQKKKLLKKIQSAGFEVNDAASLSSLGELVTGVQPNTFKKLSPENLKKSLKDLKKHASLLSTAQKRAIVEKVCNI